MKETGVLGEWRAKSGSRRRGVFLVGEGVPLRSKEGGDLEEATGLGVVLGGRGESGSTVSASRLVKTE